MKIEDEWKIAVLTVPTKKESDCLNCLNGYLHNHILLVLRTDCSTKPPEANSATYASPPSNSIQSLPLDTLSGGSHFPYVILPPRSGTSCFPFDSRRLADKDNIWQFFILDPQKGPKPSKHFSHYLLSLCTFVKPIISVNQKISFNSVTE